MPFHGPERDIGDGRVFHDLIKLIGRHEKRVVVWCIHDYLTEFIIGFERVHSEQDSAFESSPLPVCYGCQ